MTPFKPSPPVSTPEDAGRSIATIDVTMPGAAEVVTSVQDMKNAPEVAPLVGMAEPAKDPEALSRYLQLTEDEELFMERLAQCAGGSPRRVLRFLNVYQVVKASLPEHEARVIQEGGFHALMTQIAIITGAPDLLDRWVGFLRTQGQQMTPGELQKVLGKEQWLQPADQAKKLDAALRILAETAPAVTAKALRDHSELARRYSFTG